MRRVEYVNGERIDKEMGPVDRLVYDQRTGEMVLKAPVSRFIAGPIPFEWLRKAAGLPGKSVQVALAFCFLRGVKKSLSFKVTAEALTLAGCSRQAYYHALDNLEDAGLIAVARGSGRRAEVSLTNFK
jgi:hypothetical protein